jgi:hypothetical protein
MNLVLKPAKQEKPGQAWDDVPVTFIPNRGDFAISENTYSSYPANHRHITAAD